MREGIGESAELLAGKNCGQVGPPECPAPVPVRRGLPISGVVLDVAVNNFVLDVCV